MAPPPLVPTRDSPRCPGQNAGRSCRARRGQESGFSQSSPLQPTTSPAGGLSLATPAGPRETPLIRRASPKFPPRLLSPAETLLLFGDSPSRWEGTGLCWEVTASLGGARAGGTQPGCHGTGGSAPQPLPQPAPRLPAAISPLPRCCQGPLFLLWAPCTSLGVLLVSRRCAGSGAGSARTEAEAEANAMRSQGTHRAASSTATWQGVGGLQGAAGDVAGFPPGPLVLEPRAASRVSRGIGVPGGRCKVQLGLPGSCQSSLRQD